jgi:hypothetical protein
MPVFLLAAACFVGTGNTDHAQIPGNAYGYKERQHRQNRCRTPQPAFISIQL